MHKLEEELRSREVAHVHGEDVDVRYFTNGLVVAKGIIKEDAFVTSDMGWCSVGSSFRKGDRAVLHYDTRTQHVGMARFHEQGGWSAAYGYGPLESHPFWNSAQEGLAQKGIALPVHPTGYPELRWFVGNIYEKGLRKTLLGSYFSRSKRFDRQRLRQLAEKETGYVALLRFDSDTVLDISFFHAEAAKKFLQDLPSLENALPTKDTGVFSLALFSGEKETWEQQPFFHSYRFCSKVYVNGKRPLLLEERKLLERKVDDVIVHVDAAFMDTLERIAPLPLDIFMEEDKK
ncbi:hypothetical protein HY639_03750 [Candidatus Woesearchaeota archaeon]|nr:hypothetical protein [Candidatus Woesearchaeota archaeon]